jgi:hypothetical protein
MSEDIPLTPQEAYRKKWPQDVEALDSKSSPISARIITEGHYNIFEAGWNAAMAAQKEFVKRGMDLHNIYKERGRRKRCQSQK